MIFDIFLFHFFIDESMTANAPRLESVYDFFKYIIFWGGIKRIETSILEINFLKNKILYFFNRRKRDEVIDTNFHYVKS